MVNPPYQIAPNLKHKEIVHGFFGAEGGYSSGIFESLNCGLNKGDDDTKVMQNRALVCKAMGVDRMVTLKQIHKSDVLVVDQNTQNGYEYDA
ncbi:MAG: laccase domain-containing protein, partial [Alphaproteobacteria bacterium]